MVEDFHPHLVFWIQVHDGGPRCHVMVSCIGIKSFDAILTILHQTDSQVFVGQCNVIGEIINAWVCTDELARLWVVVSAFIEEDLVELNGGFLCRVAAGDSRRESRFRHEAATFAGSRSAPRSSFALVPFLPVGSWRSKQATISVLSRRASFAWRAAVTSFSKFTCRAYPALHS